MFTEWSKLEMVNLDSVHNEFQFLSVSGTIGLEVTNSPGTAKVLGLSLFLFDRFRPILYRLNGLVLRLLTSQKSLCVSVCVFRLGYFVTSD